MRRSMPHVFGKNGATWRAAPRGTVYHVDAGLAAGTLTNIEVGES